MVAVSFSSYADDDDVCGDEEGEECPELSLLGNIILYWVLVGLLVSLCLRLRYSSFVKPFVDRIEILRNVANRIEHDVRNPAARALLGCTQWCLEMVICTFLGPLNLVILLCWFFYHYFVVVPRRAERERAVELLLIFSDDRRWRARGWLIMMRARHQRSLARSKSRPVRLQELERYSEANIITIIPPEIELLEGGLFNITFVRAVMAVVETHEEGLFRHIIKFL
ncbi:unnamed protein product [Ectocarpus fasciculatus]